MGQKADTAQKATAAIKNLFSVGSDMHSGLTLVKSFLFGGSRGSGDSSREAGLQSDVKGRGQVDERLFTSACARAIPRIATELGGKQKYRTEAEERIERVIKVINSIDDPIKRGVIILTIGLEQNTKTIERPQGKDKDGKDKKPIIEKTLENLDGQEILIMLALRDDDDFTKEVCKSITTSEEVLSWRLKKAKEKIVELELPRRYCEIESAVVSFDKKLTKPTIILGVSTVALIIILVITQYFIKS